MRTSRRRRANAERRRGPSVCGAEPLRRSAACGDAVRGVGGAPVPVPHRHQEVCGRHGERIRGKDLQGAHHVEGRQGHGCTQLVGGRKRYWLAACLCCLFILLFHIDALLVLQFVILI